jgi:hypothetical protein
LQENLSEKKIGNILNFRKKLQYIDVFQIEKRIFAKTEKTELAANKFINQQKDKKWQKE